MADFTYSPPGESKYLKGILAYLKFKGHSEIADLLKDAKCSISSSSQYSRERWNAYATTIYFYVPLEVLEQLDEEIRTTLISICDAVMPRNVGFDVTWVDFSLLFDDDEDENNGDPEREELVPVTSVKEISIPEKRGDTMNNKVFVIHGRNTKLRKAMFAFLRSIGLQPIEWEQALLMTGSPSPYIGDVLDVAFGHAQAIIAMHSPDDEGRLKDVFHGDNEKDYEVNLTSQARQNVVFETGMAFGRNPERTVIVEFGDLRPYSDIAGRHTIRFRDSVAARQSLAQRLKMAGCLINLDGTDWHTEGDFIGSF
ncbi:TIR domain-containing protein [Paenibacillus glucanolyticus]|uniref:TIR domain-containing protein n=1 Tax=Paenibacillus glucanolyticus TaxID=59843 RepID=UPI0035DC679E